MLLRISLDALEAGMASANRGECQALVTAPISKEALALAGSEDRGHTEILKRGLADGPVAMSFFSPRLRVVLTTAHIPLAQVPKATEVMWVQEEPGNMGAAPFLAPRIAVLCASKKFTLVSRAGSASPATGSHHAHQLEQQEILDRALLQ